MSIEIPYQWFSFYDMMALRSLLNSCFYVLLHCLFFMMVVSGLYLKLQGGS